MKTPICSFDARTGVLCPQCDAKLRSGQLSRTDVDVSIKLTKAAEKNSDLAKISLTRAIQFGNDYVLILDPGTLAPLRRDPSFQKNLQTVLGGKIWLTEADTTDRKELEDLFFPIRVANVNTVWLPDGTKLTKVVIPGKKTERFPHDTEMISRILKETREMDLMVEFERQ
ncbi:MAG: transcription elongation factor NusA [Nitrososphaerota archaeon]|nr:transcription elongation factor NusA [Nitrososphaerota archaeon]